MRKEEPDGSVTQVWYGLPSDFERAYLDHYHRFDPWMGPARSLPVGRCLPSSELVPDRQLDDSEFFQDFLRPRGLREIVGGVLERSPGTGITTFAVMRAHGALAFSRVDAEALQRILPRIQRSLWIDRQLSQLESSGVKSNTAVFVLDLDGRIRHRNQVATRLLSAGDLRGSSRDRLSAGCPVSNIRLQARLAEAASVSPLHGSPNLLLALRRRTAAPLIASISSLGESVSTARIPGPRPGILVIIFDPHQDLDIERVESNLRTLYGLTAAEARVGALVGSGYAPAAAAGRLGITVGTARFQLKQVYAAAELAGQRDLVRLVTLLSKL